MISVEINLQPHGDVSREKTLARIIIWNDLSGSTTFGNYKYVVSHQDGYAGQLPDVRALVDDPQLGWKRGAIRNFNRRSGAVKLVAEVLRAARL